MSNSRNENKSDVSENSKKELVELESLYDELERLVDQLNENIVPGVKLFQKIQMLKADKKKDHADEIKKNEGQLKIIDEQVKLSESQINESISSVKAAIKTLEIKLYGKASSSPPRRSR